MLIQFKRYVLLNNSFSNYCPQTNETSFTDIKVKCDILVVFQFLSMRRQFVIEF